MTDASTVKKVSATGEELLGAVRAQMVMQNNSYDDRLPQVTRQSLQQFGNYLATYETAANDFIRTLINLVGRVEITYRMFTNPLRALKKGMLEFGDTVEMVYVPLAKAHAFNPAVAEKEWMKREIPSAVTAFAKLNYKVFYKATIEDDDLRAAFTSWSAFDRFVSGVFNSMWVGAEQDEYLVMKNQIRAFGEAGGFNVATIPVVTDSESAKAALASIKAVSNTLPFMSPIYNSIGIDTLTPKDKQVLLIDAEYDAYLSVLGYATLFNLEPARAQYRVIVVDSIPLDNVHAILMDEDWYAVYDSLQKFRKAENGEGLYWNYWAHYWRIVAVCPWANAVAFTTVNPTMSAFTIARPTGNSAAAPIPYGGEGTMIKNIAGTGMYPQGAVWGLDGNTSSATTISPYGTVYVAPDETATQLHVWAYSTFGGSYKGPHFDETQVYIGPANP